MFQPDPETVQILNDLNATYRIVGVAPSLEKQDGKFVPTGPSRRRAEIIDLTLNVPYCSAEADTEAEALRLAAKKAITAPKPLTPAQRAELARTQSDALIAQQAEEIERLRAELAAAKGGGDTAEASKRGRGRPRKEPAPEVEATAADLSE